VACACWPRPTSRRARFEGKGRLRANLARIPTRLVTEPYPALRGAAALLDAATP